jgi:hypothetical protein
MYLKGHTNQFKTLLYSGYISFVQNEGCWRAAGNFLFLAARKFQSEELIWTHKNCAAARITRVRTPFVIKQRVHAWREKKLLTRISSSIFSILARLAWGLRRTRYSTGGSFNLEFTGAARTWETESMLPTRANKNESKLLRGSECRF